MINIGDFDAYCFDLDGTIYLGSKLLPGVIDTIKLLRENNKQILFITNSPVQTREGCQRHLQNLGISVQIDDVITAPFVSAIYFYEHFPEANVYVVGEQVIKDELQNYKIDITENPLSATHVLVGLDRSFTYEKLNQAVNAVRNGAKLLVTNPDPACPVPGGYIPDTMAIAKAIEVASNQQIYKVIGKPSTFYGQQILKRLKVPICNKCLIIGDRLETDIMLGKMNNFHTCLVLTGIAHREDPKNLNIYPDVVIEDLYALFNTVGN